MKHIFIIAISCALAACASTGSGDDSSRSASDRGRTNCIFTPSIRGYSVLDESNLIIDASGRRKYHLVLQRRAFGIRSSWNIGFDSTGSSVCAGFSDVVFRDHFDGGSIPIKSIRELSPEDYEDLLIRFGKKEPEVEQTPAPRDVKGAEVEELDPAAEDDSSGN